MNSEQLIGAPAKRHEELAHKEFEWHSFYNGWVEGRIALLQEQQQSGQKPKKQPTRFQKPSLEDVAEYCAERQNNVDAERFINHYESNGWKVGKNTMKDWKAAVRTWEKNNTNERNNNNKQSVSNNSVNIAGSTTGKISARTILTRRYKEQINTFVPGENQPPTT